MVRRNNNNNNRKGSSKGSDPDTVDPYGLNEVDEFASKKEKLLLEQSTLSNQRNDDDDFLEDEEEEEVLGMTDEESGSEELEEEQAEQDDDEEEEEGLDGAEAYRKVFGRSLDADQRVDEEAEGGMLDNENAWGSNKGEYYGADDLDDEETAKEIEKEALRQQKKHLQELNMNDYMDDEVEEEWVKSAKEFDVKEFQNTTKQTETSASIKDIMKMDEDSKREYLKTMFPEYLPLSKELASLSDVLVDLKTKEESETTKLKIMALCTYLGTISSYFGILLHELKNNDDFFTMKDHPVMESILTSKEVWRQAKELPEEFNANNTAMEDQEQTEDIPLEATELEEMDEDMLANVKTLPNNGEVDDDKISSEAEEGEEEEEDGDRDADLDDFEEYVAQSRLSRKSSQNGRTQEEEADDYQESEMVDVDAQEKKARRRTLRFYTSKIDQQGNKKVDKFKGDDDIPYKERFFERQQRLVEEARKRGISDANAVPLDNRDIDSAEEEAAKTLNQNTENDYYKQIQLGRQNKKNARTQAHKKAVIAAREGKLSELAEEIGDDGKRAINYQILKNKGLTPKRKKDNRNSRVKKRKKFEKAQKKLKSVRAVYSGGQSGVYEGEKTGIKKNLTRSVKFKN
ncbi:rRNA-processing protein SAS10 NDAI_0A02020 [Naumovozyma dairenensis CBS 421]|uniref:Sas10 C-terminal domain-containing protein n=1 Tax=Naumovozyma dairenensis (strain ATCC 10597 / BCRC 20456 / CBS 421 / NBRC 0211 / NRRL Y-12639) TaxID=1071378 RepID=G0W3H2_NAUDC|nr:hypothetical protein NDAI_0A02020 [Naumovozyma dairenensis CBS 421]CCD22360.1 hypothetical protein NDAI_0A02020 [Naumovozyma dairenensis CBS 421]